MEHKGVGPYPPNTTLLEPLQRCGHQWDDQTSWYPMTGRNKGFTVQKSEEACIKERERLRSIMIREAPRPGSIRPALCPATFQLYEPRLVVEHFRASVCTSLKWRLQRLPQRVLPCPGKHKILRQVLICDMYEFSITALHITIHLET